MVFNVAGIIFLRNFIMAEEMWTVGEHQSNG
jgi:hypothetical protein